MFKFNRGEGLLGSRWKTFHRGSGANLGLFTVFQNSNSLTWNNYKTVSQNTPSISWTNFGSQPSAYQLVTWNNYKTVSQNTPSVSWNTYSDIQVLQDTESISWKNYKTVSQNTENISWDLIPLLSQNTPSISWNTYKTTNRFMNNVSWKVFKRVFKNTEEIPWSVTFIQVSQDTPSLIWNTKGKVTAPIENLKWNLGGKVSKNTVSFRWQLGGNVSNDSRLLAWNVNGVLDMAFGLQAYKFPKFRVPNNVNYLSVRNITVTNSSGMSMPTGTTVEFELDTASMLTAGDIDEFCDNFRLTWATSNRSEKEIDLDVISPNSGTTILRFKLQAGLANGDSVSDYRIYYRVKNPNLFEETFRDRKGVYYFWASQLSSNFAQTNGTWSNSSAGIKRVSDASTAKLGFNVPDDADVEIDFRFLDAGASDQSRYIGIEWRGDGSASRTFRLDNDNGTANNQVEHYYNGSSWTVLSSPVDNIKTEQGTMRVKVLGSTVELYLNGTLLDTVTDGTASTGGMQIVLPSGSEAIITALRVKQATGTYSVSLSSGLDNLRAIPSKTTVRLSDTRVQNVQSTVIRLKRQPDNTFILEDMRTIGEGGDSYDATVDQNDSIEIALVQTSNLTLATVRKLIT